MSQPNAVDLMNNERKKKQEISNFTTFDIFYEIEKETIALSDWFRNSGDVHRTAHIYYIYK